MRQHYEVALPIVAEHTTISAVSQTVKCRSHTAATHVEIDEADGAIAEQGIEAAGMQAAESATAVGTIVRHGG